MSFHLRLISGSCPRGVYPSHSFLRTRPALSLITTPSRSPLRTRLFHASLIRPSSPPPPPPRPDQRPPPPSKESAEPEPKAGAFPKSLKPVLHENIYTIPNLLTLSRLVASPFVGYFILQGQFVHATALLAYAGFTDLADGYLARRFKASSVLGTILDPAADKFLMTVLTVTLAMKGMLPLYLAAIILGRDLALSLSAFYIRYISLPEPKTFARYWDFSIPSAEVHPTYISKVNTALQLCLVGATTVSPLLPFNLDLPLSILQWTVAGTTIWSGLSYVFTKDAVKFIGRK